MKSDIVIIGAGAAGLSLATLLAENNINITIIEKSDLKNIKNPEYDGRETALTHSSIKILKEINAWQNIEKESISPILEAKVLNGYSKYSLDFDSKNTNQEALGYLVANNVIRKALFKEVEKLKNIEIIDNISVLDIKNKDQNSLVTLSNNKVIETKLLIAADSRFSKIRNKMGISTDIHDFARAMIVCKMEHEQDHKNIALECFYEDRVMAILPLKGKISSIVTTLPINIAEEMTKIDEEAFNADINQYLEKILGKVKLTGKRYLYPLTSTYANKFIDKRFAVIGDAAVGMHPVTAHGFNLGLLGQKNLTDKINQAIKNNEDIGSDKLLQKYQKQHIKDTKIMYHGTNIMVNIFTNNKISAKILRSLMLRTANNRFLPFKSMIANRLSGEKPKIIKLFNKIFK
ncbi:5-demethoxyubiquinol-8 5-hydroxylase UbiM [Rickettsiales bacterium]|nr:5-demethoxyubiquinol-8 5-hydroxylase UbiM [Rickettsiales bacterium]